ncbi:hypothetical protein [Dokdonia sp. R86516]|uniref:hypothetical protein n=1 Tax=Dokdonia sp. R86516 TaxID=3093856 RepID=UPI0037C71189
MQLPVNTRTSFENSLIDTSTTTKEPYFAHYKFRKTSTSNLSNHQIAAKTTLEIFAKA